MSALDTFKKALIDRDLDALKASINQLSKEELLDYFQNDRKDSLLRAWLAEDAKLVRGLLEALTKCLPEIYSIICDGKTILQEAAWLGKIDVFKVVLEFCPQGFLVTQQIHDFRNPAKSLLQLSLACRGNGFEVFELVYKLYNSDTAQQLLAFKENGEIKILASAAHDPVLFSKVLAYFPPDKQQYCVNSVLFRDAKHTKLRKSLTLSALDPAQIGKEVAPNVETILSILQIYPARLRRSTMQDNQYGKSPLTLAKNHLSKGDFEELNEFLDMSDGIAALEKSCSQYLEHLQRCILKALKPYSQNKSLISYFAKVNMYADNIELPDFTNGITRNVIHPDQASVYGLWLRDNVAKMNLLIDLKTVLGNQATLPPEEKFTQFCKLLADNSKRFKQSITPFELNRLQHILAIVFSLGGYAVYKAIQSKIVTGSFAYYRSRDLLFTEKIDRQIKTFDKGSSKRLG